MGSLLYLLTRSLKRKQSSDIQYFLFPWTYTNYSIYLGENKKLFEKGFPAHPFIQECRTNVINKSCFSYPQIVKNEIEYLHTKLCQKTGKDSETSVEREFEIGNSASYDYKKLLTHKGVFEPQKQQGPRFKIIVEEGEVFFQCVDSFEEVFQVSKEMVSHMEITDLLDPYLFDNHKDIINALFLVYYELSTAYVDEFYHKPR
jgi:hypothetical protein